MIIQNSHGGTVSFKSDDPRLGEYMSGFTGSVQMLGTGNISYRRLYETETWVHICVNKLSRGLGRIPLKTYVRDGENRKRLRSEDDDLARLIYEPFEGGSTFDLVDSFVHEYSVHGSGPVAMLSPGPGQPPTELVPLDWQYLQAWFIGGVLQYYTWHRDGWTEKPVKLLPREVLDFGFYRRRSPLAALALTLQLESAAKRQTRSWFEGGGGMAGVVTTEGKAMTAAQVKELEERLQTQHSGPDKKFRLAILANMPQAKVTTLEHSADALQMTDTRRLNREETCAVYDIPPNMVGILDNSNFSNIDTANRMLAVQTFMPHTSMIEQRFASRLIRRFPKWRDHFVEFDFTKLLEGNPLEEAEAHMKWLLAGYTPNELRRKRNQPRIDQDGADDIWIPSNLTPIGDLNPLSTQTPP